MRYGIFKVEYFGTFTYVPAHEDNQCICYAAKGFEKYEYILDYYFRELFIEYQSKEDYLKFAGEDSIVCNFLSILAEESIFQEWRKLNPHDDPRVFLKLNSYYNMLDS